MSVQVIIGYCILSAILLLTGWLIDEELPWSAGANWTIPWLCSVFALRPSNKTRVRETASRSSSNR